MHNKSSPNFFCQREDAARWHANPTITAARKKQMILRYRIKQFEPVFLQ